MKTSRLTHQASLHRRARRYKEEFLNRHFGRPRRIRRPFHRWPSIATWRRGDSNVVGVGYGLKHVGGAGIGADEALRVYVRRKLPLRHVRKADRVPCEINGLPTDVIEVGVVRAAAWPAMGGSSGANMRVAAGTLGCMVRGRTTKENYILSCFHVLAALDDPEEHDPIYEPARQDGGVQAIGQLHRWIDLNPNGNLVDCAVADINTPGTFLSEIRGLGEPNPPPIAAATQQSVKKSGRDAPGVTLGVITDVSADVQVEYPQGTYGFVQQIAIQGVGGAFAGRGDSGALVVDAGTLQPVGLLFSVGSGLGFANPIGDVLDYLGVDVV
jgi:hypothetical protein